MGPFVRSSEHQMRVFVFLVTRTSIAYITASSKPRNCKQLTICVEIQACMSARYLLDIMQGQFLQIDSSEDLPDCKTYRSLRQQFDIGFSSWSSICVKNKIAFPESTGNWNKLFGSYCSFNSKLLLYVKIKFAKNEIFLQFCF